MAYKYLVKKENGFIIDWKKQYSNDMSYSAPDGYEIADRQSQEYKDFIGNAGDYSEEEKFKRNASPQEKRRKEYGSPQEQLEYIVENGLEAFIAKQQTIKTKYPKEKK